MCKKIIKHVAIIMDGNGRWAKKKGKNRIFGHKYGIKSVFRVINFSLLHNIKFLTLYAFSTENWNRPYFEVNNLMYIFQYILKKKIYYIHKKNIRLKIIGNIKKLSVKLQKNIFFAEKLTHKNSNLILNIAINYGGRWDIIQAVKKIIKQVKDKKLLLKDITEKKFDYFLSVNDFNPVDLVIRTGGKYRVSNFLLWQIAYSEFFFTKVLWPDFNDKIFQCAIDIFYKRKRSFGML
ncbi:polyprenyl diphosphate synthase [Buchnera aphidicola]|uniref:polyprenyl diphosphate synthase n=1 Tax=Buchnera aphidicola TaxID=9 RepID=UPI0031B8A779